MIFRLAMVISMVFTKVSNLKDGHNGSVLSAGSAPALTNAPGHDLKNKAAKMRRRPEICSAVTGL